MGVGCGGGRGFPGPTQSHGCKLRGCKKLHSGQKFNWCSYKERLQKWGYGGEWGYGGALQIPKGMFHGWRNNLFMVVSLDPWDINGKRGVSGVRLDDLAGPFRTGKNHAPDVCARQILLKNPGVWRVGTWGGAAGRY